LARAQRSAPVDQDGHGVVERQHEDRDRAKPGCPTIRLPGGHRQLHAARTHTAQARSCARPTHAQPNLTRNPARARTCDAVAEIVRMSASIVSESTYLQAAQRTA
jgi:hypothetical protein